MTQPIETINNDKYFFFRKSSGNSQLEVYNICGENFTSQGQEKI